MKIIARDSWMDLDHSKPRLLHGGTIYINDHATIIRFNISIACDIENVSSSRFRPFFFPDRTISSGGKLFFPFEFSCFKLLFA